MAHTTLNVEPRKYGYSCTCGASVEVPTLAEALEQLAGHNDWHEWVDHLPTFEVKTAASHGRIA